MKPSSYPWFSALIAVGVLLILPALSQAKPALKLGDRVKVTIGNGFKGVVTQVVATGDYVIKLDIGGENGTPLEFKTSGKNGIIMALGPNDVEVADVNDLEKLSAGTPEDSQVTAAAPAPAPEAATPVQPAPPTSPAVPNEGGIFKVGDRVEVREGPDRWPAGTIIKGLEHNLYFIRMDAPPGQPAPEIPAVPEEVRAAAAAKDGLLPGQSPENTALGDQSKFHVGERVEVGSGSLRATGTVTRGLQSNQYLVLLDKYVGKGMSDYIALPDDIRALHDGSKAPVIPDFPAVRDPIDPPVQEPTKKSGPPPLALVRQLIQSFQETRTDTSVINLDVHTVEIGKPRKMVAELDRDVVGDANTMLYPVHATLTHRTYEDNGKSVLIAERDNLYSFYVDSFGHWACVLPTSKTVKPTQSWTKP